MIKQRNIALCIVFSIITFGIMDGSGHIRWARKLIS